MFPYDHAIYAMRTDFPCPYPSPYPTGVYPSSDFFSSPRKLLLLILLVIVLFWFIGGVRF